MTDPQRPDWPAIIAELEAAKVTLHIIAKLLQVQFGQVQRWKTGTEPKHYDGERLLMLHRHYLQNEVTKQSSSTTQHAKYGS